MNTKFIEELRRTCESTNINFLLGAGCSFPAFGTLGNSERLWEQLKQDGADPGIAAAAGADTDEIERLIEAHLKAEFFTGAILPNKTYRGDRTKSTMQTKTNYQSFCIASMKLAAKREASTLPKQVTFFVTNTTFAWTSLSIRLASQQTRDTPADSIQSLTSATSAGE